MLSCINDSYNRKVYIILNYATWRKRCFVCSKRERDLLTECSMGRDDAKDLGALTQSTIMYIQSSPFAVELEGSGRYSTNILPTKQRITVHTHTHTHVVSGSGRHHKSTLQQNKELRAQLIRHSLLF
jgi:hypothetical protein